MPRTRTEVGLGSTVKQGNNFKGISALAKVNLLLQNKKRAIFSIRKEDLDNKKVNSEFPFTV